MRFTLPLVFFLLALALRLPVVLAHLDTWYPFEVHSGTIAVALLDGLDVDWARLPIVEHIRGNVVFGLLLAPIYAAFGVSSLTLKIVPLVWHAATIALLVALLLRHAGRAAALCAGLALLLAPPAFQKLSTLALSSHMESMLLFVLALWPLLAMARTGRFTPGRCFAFGAALGFAGFFHLQALLPCLLLVALLLWGHGRDLTLRGAGAVVLGAALFAAPSFLFDGGNVELLQAMRGSGQARPLDLDEGDARATPLAKATGLFTGDFAGSLEFSEVRGSTGPVLGGFAAALLLGLFLLAAWQQRGVVAAMLLRPVRRGAGPPPTASLVFGAHALLMVAMYAVSHTTAKPALSAGASNRQLAPLWFAMLAVAGIAVGSLWQGGRRRAAACLGLLLTLPGLIGWIATVRAEPANRIAQRGECYEWFRPHLVKHAGGRDAAPLIDLIGRVDRGDPRFRTLRFDARLALTPADDRDLFQKERRLRERMAPIPALFALTALGRKLAEQYQGGAMGAVRPWLLDPVFVDRLNAMDRTDAAALLHGVGLEFEPPRVGGELDRLELFFTRLRKVFEVLPRPYARQVAEGYGFGLGHVHDPYNWRMGELLRRQSELPAELLDDVFRGFGWGYRQRYLAPPATIPDGLVVLDHIPEAHRPAFVAAYCGQALPAEAGPMAEASEG